MSRPLALVVATLVAGPHSIAHAAPTTRRGPAVVTHLQGRAVVLRNAHRFLRGGGFRRSAPWRPLRVRSTLQPHDAIRTAAGARLAVTFADGSRVRLGPNSTMTVERARFGAQQRQVTVRLWLGRLWARVAHRLGARSNFEVKTTNAVAGVRGTSFAVLARADLSSVIKVYTGTVGVRKTGETIPARQNYRVAGPRRIDRPQWEEVIATAMRQVRITHLGEIQPAEDFVDLGNDASWARWNRRRDKR